MTYLVYKRTQKRVARGRYVNVDEVMTRTDDLDEAMHEAAEHGEDAWVVEVPS